MNGAGEPSAVGGGAPMPPERRRIARVWVVGQSLADGPAKGSPPPETPLAAVPLWVRDGTGAVGPDGQNFDAFTALQQPPGFGHGGELQCGVELWKAGIPNIQIKFAKGATSIAMWSPVGKHYGWLREEIPQVLAASEAAFPGATFSDHLVINAGQYEATSTHEAYALEHTHWIGQVRAGYEALLGHPLLSLHIELTQLGIKGGTWIDTVRTRQLAVPNARFVNYDDLPTTDGIHPDAAGHNVLGARRGASILGVVKSSLTEVDETG